MRRPPARPPAETSVQAILRGPPPTAAEVERRLREAGELDFDLADETAGWRFGSTLPDDPWALRVARTAAVRDLHLAAGQLDPADREAIDRSRWSVEAATDLAGGHAAERFARLLQLLRVSAPDAVAVLDTDGGALRPASWLHEAAVPGVPVRLDALYRIHAVSGDTGRAWLHTHGLRRCGLAEIEILDVDPDHLQAAGALIQAAAHRALVHGLPDLGEEVAYGHGLRVALVPWTYVWPDLAGRGVDADADAPAIELGGPGDRDEAHVAGNLALVTWRPVDAEHGAWVSAAERLGHLGDSPVFFLTDYETDRLEALARLRWRAFALMASHLAEAGDWQFLAKFSYGGTEGSTREHLWFQVHDADATKARATLLNHPYQALGLRPGDRAEPGIDRLTDFRVAGPLGTATPDTIDRLMRRWLGTLDEQPQ